ncbi:MAG: efflux transporter outer membrane subunit [Lentisphaeria bacterium]|nr:efflux transporter outer membrane subunit [Lentisphaeria bacterium]
MIQHWFLTLSAAGALLLGGCLNMAPEYRRPGAPVPDAWPSGAAAGATEAPTPPELPWNAFYADPVLQELVTIALENNRDLRLAVKNTDLAAALYGIERDTLYPSFYASAGGALQKQSQHLIGDNQPRRAKAYDVNFGVLSWEPDFFGRIRNLSDEARETFLAAAENWRGARILLTSSVAKAYLSLVADRESLALAEATLKTQRDAYSLIKRQFDEGLATELTLRQAQITVETARGDVARLSRQVTLDRNALTLLLGAALPDTAQANTLNDIRDMTDIAAGLPSELLLQRPDIMAAEHRLKAANAFIGVARAAFFPSISLTAVFGTASNQLAGLFEGGSGTWSFVPQMALPIFDARTWSGYRVSKAKQELALVEYERTIQAAFREVSDALAVRDSIGLQLEAQEALVQALMETHRLANIRYEQGIDSFLNVLDAQRNLFSAQQGLIALRLAQATNKVHLYAVLGGDAGAPGGDTPDAPEATR